MGKIKKILENELVGGTQTTDVYPVTSTKAVYDENNKSLYNILNRVEPGIIYDVSALNDGAVFESLSALLSSSNLSTLIPTSVRHGGMSIRFVQSSDNKYVQYRLMTNQWSTTPTDWQGIDETPIAGSQNLVISGGVYKKIDYLVDYKFNVVSGEYISTINVIKISLKVNDVLYLKFDFGGNNIWLDVHFRNGSTRVDRMLIKGEELKKYIVTANNIDNIMFYSYDPSTFTYNASFYIYSNLKAFALGLKEDSSKELYNRLSDVYKNIYNNIPVYNGRYIKSDGSLIDTYDSNGYYTDWIPVSYGDKFLYTGGIKYSEPYIYVTKDILGNVVTNDNSSDAKTDYEISINNTAISFIRFGAYGVEPIITYYDNSKKTIEDEIKNIEDEIKNNAIHSIEIKNLFDPSKVTDNYYIQNNVLSANSSMVVSDYIPIEVGETYCFPVNSGFFGVTATQVCTYDENKEFIGNEIGTLLEFDILRVTIAKTNARYIRITATKGRTATSSNRSKWKHNYSTFMVVNANEYPSRFYPYGERKALPKCELDTYNYDVTDPLFGKVAIFDGDSICNASSERNSTCYGWAGRIGMKHNMLWGNFSTGGGTFTDGGWGTHVISNADYNGATNPDYIIIEGGTNDADRIGSILNGDIPEKFGSYDNRYDGNYDNTTYCGAIEKLFKYLLSNYPYAKIGVIIAMKMGTYAKGYNKDVNNRRAYFETLMKLCEKWGIPYINLWDSARLNPNLLSNYDLTLGGGNDYDLIADANIAAGKMYIDGQHLTAYGYNVITPMIEAWMKTL